MGYTSLTRSWTEIYQKFQQTQFILSNSEYDNSDIAGPQGRATRTTSPSPPLSSPSSPPPSASPGSPLLSSSESELPPYSLLPPNQSPNTWTDRFEGAQFFTSTRTYEKDCLNF